MDNIYVTYKQKMIIMTGLKLNFCCGSFYLELSTS